MKLPLNSSQIIAAVAVTGVLLAGAFALGRSQNAAAPAQTEAAKPALSSKAEGLCGGCSRVVAVHTEERTSKTSGVGVVGGAVIGGLLGNQVGGGNGKKIATVGGAVAGGFAGNEIEKRRNAHQVWVIKLEGEDGVTHTREQASNPNLQVGDVVTVRDGQLLRR